MHWCSLLLPCLSTVSAFTSPLTFRTPPTRRFVSAVESPPVADMPRGMGGRIEEAFAAAKERGEAAFVTFVTAGYPTAAGTYHGCH